MGSSVNCACECGFSGYAKIGGGISSFKELCLFPGYCEKCNDVVEVNLYADLKCPECSGIVVPYTDSSLLGNHGDRDVVSYFDYKLTNGNYKCPKCGKMSLHFFNDYGINWD